MKKNRPHPHDMNVYLSDAGKHPKPDKNNIWRCNKAHSEIIYNIAALEDSPYSYVEVKTLLDGFTVGGHSLAEQELILNQHESWQLLYKSLASKSFEVTKSFMCGLHAVVARKEALEWGVFRTGQAFIAGTDYVPPRHENLDCLFEMLQAKIKPLHPIDQAINLFIWTSKYQFFYDGNKRTGRLIANGILLTHDYYVIDIPNSKRLEYNELMKHFYDTNDVTLIGDFLLECINN